MYRVEQCKICHSWLKLDENMRLPEHNHMKTGNPCRGRWPYQQPPCYQEYPINSVSDFAEISGGLPELGKHR